MEDYGIEEEPTLRPNNGDESAGNLATELKRRLLDREKGIELNTVLLELALADDRSAESPTNETVSPQTARKLGDTALISSLLSHTDGGLGIDFDKLTSEEIGSYISENNYQHALEMAQEGPEKERARQNAVYANLRVYGKRLIQYHTQQAATHARKEKPVS